MTLMQTSGRGSRPTPLRSQPASRPACPGLLYNLFIYLSVGRSELHELDLQSELLPVLIV